MMASMMNTSVFYQLPASDALYHSQYEVKAGRWPESYNECVAVLGADGSITDYASTRWACGTTPSWTR